MHVAVEPGSVAHEIGSFRCWLQLSGLGGYPVSKLPETLSVQPVRLPTQSRHSDPRPWRNKPRLPRMPVEGSPSGRPARPFEGKWRDL